MPRSSAKAKAPAERGRLAAASTATAARRASQPKLGEIGTAGTLIGCAGEATGAAGATMGAGRTMDGPSCAWAGTAAKSMAADSMKAATRSARRPNMVPTVAIQPPAVKVVPIWQFACLRGLWDHEPSHESAFHHPRLSEEPGRLRAHAGHAHPGRP